MEIIYENLPESNDKINLIIESSLLNKNPEIIINNNHESIESKNEIIINKKIYKFSNIFTNFEKEKCQELIISEINIKNNINLLLYLNNNKEEENNHDKSNYNTEIRNNIQNLFNKENIEKLKIKNIIYNYYQINLETNKNENIIKDKIINKENNDNYSIEIPNDDENNINISFLKLNIEFSDLNISSFIKIFFIYNSLERIIPLFAVNQKENDLIILKEKVNNLLSLEKDIKEKINNLPMINADYIQNAQNYEKEVINYYDNFLKNLENLEKSEKSAKKVKNKNNINDTIKDAKNILKDITNEQFKQREKDIYQKYIETYSNITKTTTENNNENNNNTYNYEDLKIIINKFNNLNEELLEMLENDKTNNNNKKEEKNETDKNKEIEELKNRIKQLEKELEEKSKPPSEIKINKKDKDKNKKNNRSMSEAKMNNTGTGTGTNNINRLEEENRNLKMKIEELNGEISKLKINNDNLVKTNERLLKEKNNLKNDLIKEKNTNSASNNIKTELSSFHNKNKSNIKSKKFNKNKTSMEPLINGHSLLLLKKIQDENKELAKQLKDFNSKNFQLELSIKGINSGDNTSNMKSRTSNASKLSNFTNNTMNELKNIEKKYGISKK